jgi:hypothetical protein
VPIVSLTVSPGFHVANPFHPAPGALGTASRQDACPHRPAPIPGRIEFRIPFTDRFPREHFADYDTPEVQEARLELAACAGKAKAVKGRSGRA